MEERRFCENCGVAWTEGAASLRPLWRGNAPGRAVLREMRGSRASPRRPMPLADLLGKIAIWALVSLGIFATVSVLVLVFVLVGVES